jgi:ATP dependent DNA ligase domain
VLPAPALLRSGEIPRSRGHGYELKWDGFRAVVSTVEALRVRSRRGWNMATLVPELEALPASGVFDGELVAFGEDGLPSFPLLCQRMLQGDRSIAVVFVVFDVLELEGRPMMRLPLRDRRACLEELELNSACWRTSPLFDDGEARRDGTRARGPRREATLKALSAWRARLDQGEEPRLLALRARARRHAQRWRSGRTSIAERSRGNIRRDRADLSTHGSGDLQARREPWRQQAQSPARPTSRRSLVRSPHRPLTQVAAALACSPGRPVLRARYPMACATGSSGAFSRSSRTNSRIQAGWSGQARAETICPSITASLSTNSAPTASTSGARAG